MTKLLFNVNNVDIVTGHFIFTPNLSLYTISSKGNLAFCFLLSVTPSLYPVTIINGIVYFSVGTPNKYANFLSSKPSIAHVARPCEVPIK